MRRELLFSITLVFFAHLPAASQETVFSILKRESKLADDYCREKNHKAALDIYTRLYARDSASQTLPLKIGRCAYSLKDYSMAVSAYSQLQAGDLPFDDLYSLAESLTSIGNHKDAIACYQLCIVKSPDNHVISQKIWRLNNIRYLYEDSMHYAVRFLPINTISGELAAVRFNQGLVFISNRKQIQVVEKIDGTSLQPFYNTYYAAAYIDSSGNTLPHYRSPILFNKALFNGLHAGPMAFYDHGTKMVFASSSEESGSSGARTLHLFFAELQNGQWRKTSSFPSNSNDFSITDPSISEDGTKLYFSADMPGGFGQRDIYRSFYSDGQWSMPENLGEAVNTAYDEVTPYLHLGQMLYFSSSGHPGLGGLDIFKTALANSAAGDVENVGYPINSPFDEFGITIDSLSTHGYFSSNRKKGGYDDDLYEFDMDLQTYPLGLTGMMRYKEFSWSDSTELKPFANAHFFLIDNLRDVVVEEGMSDEKGNFHWTIPYFSKYRVRVIGPDDDEHIVSLEIPKHRRQHSNHDIVIVKDAFR